MDYLLDKYFFDFLPFTFNTATRKMITSKAVDILRVADWACKAQDIRKLAENHPSFLLAEGVFLLLYILTLVHALRHGRRYFFTWLGVAFIGISMECIRFFNPAWDVVWHAQGTLTFLGMRIPWYLFGMYQFVFYVSYVFAKRLYLQWWAEAPAAGLIAAILIFPVNLFGVKLLWFQWHSTDIAVADRWLSIPWSSLLFSSCASCYFVWFLRLLRKFALPERYDWKLFMREFFCSCGAALMAVLLVAIKMDLLVHTCRGIWQINMGIPTCAILGLFTLLFFSNDRQNNRREARSRGEMRYWFDELFCAISIHFLFFMILPLITDPGSIVAEGLHQPIGLCNKTESYRTLAGTVVQRRKYFCPYADGLANLFDFHCLPDRLPPHPEGVEFVEWYPICGKDYDNRWEYMLLIWSFSLLSFAVLYQIGTKSGKTPVDLVKLHEAYVRNKLRNRYPYRQVVKSFLEEQDSEDFSSSSSSRRGSEEADVARTPFSEASGDSKAQMQPANMSMHSEGNSDDYDYERQQQRDEEQSLKTPLSSVVREKIPQSNSSTRTTKVKTTSSFEYTESPRTLRIRKRNT